MYLFLRAKKKVFPEYLFFANGKFRKFRVYKFQPHRINDKKKTVGLEDMRQISVKTMISAMMEKLLLFILKKAEFTNTFCAYFFLYIYFWEIWIFWILNMYLLSQMPFKRKFCVYLILSNRPKFAKFVKKKQAKISTLKVDFPEFQFDDIIKN